MKVKYPDFKAFVLSRGVSPQYVQLSNFYIVKAFDGPFELTCELSLTNDSSSYADFEATLKPKANKPVTANVVVQSQTPFGSKSVLINGASKKLFAANAGIKSAVVAGSNVIDYTVTLPWVKMIGAEVINSEALDTVSFFVHDTALGSYSGVQNKMLSQFANNQNVPKDYYNYSSVYDADLYLGMVIRVIYWSNSAKTIGLNFLLNEVV